MRSLPEFGILVGMQADFTFGSDNRSSNTSAYIEWLTPFTFFDMLTPFAKANIGMFVYHEDDKDDVSGVLASVSAGADIDLIDRVYVAPSLSVGYPFLWAVTVSAGWKF